MKKLLVSLAVVTALCATLVCAHRQSILSTDPLFANVEALTQIEESVITCNKDPWGLCHTPDYRSELWGLFMYYYCRWTGSQSDECPWSIYIMNLN